MEVSVPDEQHQVLGPCPDCHQAEFRVWISLDVTKPTADESKSLASTNPAMLIITNFVGQRRVQFAASGRTVQDSVAYSAECYQVSLDVATKGAAPSHIRVAARRNGRLEILNFRKAFPNEDYNRHIANYADPGVANLWRRLKRRAHPRPNGLRRFA
jgi:hypothetical protein